MSTEPRTVHVNVLVTKSLEIDEPSWCVGHDADRAQFRPDITHNGPEVSAQIETGRGPAPFLTAWFSQSPYGARPEPLPILAIEVGGDIVNCESTSEVRAFTNLVRAHLDVIEELAVELERVRESEAQ